MSTETMPDTALKGDPKRALSHEAKAASELRRMLSEHPDMDADDLADAVEGETQLNEVCAKLLQRALYLDAQAKGVKQYMDDLRARKDRMEHSADTLRAMVLQAMETAGIKTIKDPTLTASARPVTPSAVIENEAEIPADFWKPQDPKLDKRAVTDALKEGQEVPGARLSNGGLSLSVRVK